MYFSRLCWLCVVTLVWVGSVTAQQPDCKKLLSSPCLQSVDKFIEDPDGVVGDIRKRCRDCKKEEEEIDDLIQNCENDPAVNGPTSFRALQVARNLSRDSICPNPQCAGLLQWSLANMTELDEKRISRFENPKTFRKLCQSEDDCTSNNTCQQVYIDTLCMTVSGEERSCAVLFDDADPKFCEEHCFNTFKEIAARAKTAEATSNVKCEVDWIADFDDRLATMCPLGADGKSCLRFTRSYTDMNSALKVVGSTLETDEFCRCGVLYATDTCSQLALDAVCQRSVTGICCATRVLNGTIILIKICFLKK
eukprot:811262_1